MAANERKATFLSSIGAGLEYYDFIIYGMMADKLSLLFFPADTAWLGLSKIFAIFAIGYFARPLGGIFFGLVGDTYGRKSSFVLVMSLMATATLGIGLLPTYEQIGFLAPCFLSLFRFLQGISVGAELPGAITVVCEHAEAPKHGVYSGIVIAGTGVGSILAFSLLYLLTIRLTPEQILTGYWRLPFLLGGVLAVVNYYIRQHLHETPEFIRMKSTSISSSSLKEPFVVLVRDFPLKLIQGVGMTLFTSSLVIGGLYLPTYLDHYYGYNSGDIYLATIGGLLWSVGALPFCGQLADRFDKKTMLTFTALGFSVCAFPLFSLLDLQSFVGLLAFMMLYQSVLAMATTCYFPLVSSLFPTAVRFTGIAFCYNFAYSAMATLPLVIMAMIRYNEIPGTFICVLIMFALLSGASVKSLEIINLFVRRKT